MSNRRNTQFTYSPHNKAVLLDCSFTVTPTNGTGVTALNTSGRIGSVFMHTSTTPAKGPNGLTNPNPAAGYIIVNLQDNYATFLNANISFGSVVTGSAITVSTASSLTVGSVYQIVTLGSTTQANWVALGLPSYIKAAVGVVFVSALTAGTGSGTVKALAYSGVDHGEVLGFIGGPNVNLMTSTGSNVIGSGIGQQVILGCYAAGTLTAPSAGCQISIELLMNDTASGV